MIAGSRDGVAPPYPLKVLKPMGFDILEGIRDAVPVSATQSVAFASNKAALSGKASLLSFTLSKTGVCSSARTFGSGMGEPRNVAALWILPSGPVPSGAGGYGLVYALFQEAHTKPDWAALTVGLSGLLHQ